jgi:hypothetical protein
LTTAVARADAVREVLDTIPDDEPSALAPLGRPERSRRVTVSAAGIEGIITNVHIGRWCTRRGRRRGGLTATNGNQAGQ